MSKRKQFFLAALIFLLVSLVWAGSAWPVGIYFLGELKAELSRRGHVAGTAAARLDVPWHRQEHSLSCEAATLKMVLDFYGVNIPEPELIQKLQFDETSRRAGVWGDPEQGFVGSIDGVMAQSGYGVYAGPIALLAQNWKKAEVLRRSSPADIARHLAEGRPVIIWGHTGRGQKVFWTTPQGGQVIAVNGEHTRVAVGFTGTADAPTSFILLDPIYGELHWKTPKFDANWAALDRMAVAVYPDEP